MDLDRISLGEGLRSPSALVLYTWQCKRLIAELRRSAVIVVREIPTSDGRDACVECGRRNGATTSIIDENSSACIGDVERIHCVMHLR